MIALDNLKEQAAKSLDKFRERVLPIEWTPRGILTSEGFALCAMCDLCGIDMVVESGIGHGRSTEILHRYLPDAALTALDWQMPDAKIRQLQAMGVIAYRADANDWLLPRVQRAGDRRVGVFIDGPKGQPAIDLAVQCMALDHVLFVGVHDLSAGLNHQERRAFDALPDDKWHTDAEWFVDQYAHLDADDSHWDEEQGTLWMPWLRCERGKPAIRRGSYGYTIGYLYKELQDAEGIV